MSYTKNSPLFRGYKRVLNFLKGMQIMTPGFISRNVQGGLFNNLFLQRIPVQAHMDWLALRTARSPATFERRLAKIAARFKDPSAKERIRSQWEEIKTFAHQGQASSEYLRNAKRGRLSKVSPMRAFGVGNEFAEDFLRGSVAFHVMVNEGADARAALSQINKFHFNYDNLSQFERNGVKSVIPFYTWQRNNLPLMWEQMVRHPGVFNKYGQFKQELESNGAMDPYVPGWIKEGGGMKRAADTGGSCLMPLSRTS
jgi:hypothetical protein